MVKRSRKAGSPKESPIKLPNDLHEALLKDQYSVEVRVSVGSQVDFESPFDDANQRLIGTYFTGEIYFLPLRSDSDAGTLVGEIQGYRLKPNTVKAVMAWADQHDGELLKAYEWLSKNQRNFKELKKVNKEQFPYRSLYIDKVFVKPEWRGAGLTLKSVATYIDLIDPDFVFLQSHPLSKESSELSSTEKKRQSKRLAQYWVKLGLQSFSNGDDIYVAGLWNCPKWLALTRAN